MDHANKPIRPRLHLLALFFFSYLVLQFWKITLVLDNSICIINTFHNIVTSRTCPGFPYTGYLPLSHYLCSFLLYPIKTPEVVEMNVEEKAWYIGATKQRIVKKQKS